MNYREWLNKIDLSNFRITQARQDRVYQQIKENAAGDFDFFLLTIFSTIIITLGLVIDSSAVVIGGMLIAPVVWPVLLLSLATIMGRSRFLEKSILTVFKSTLLILLTALVIGLFVPDVLGMGSEILSRTQPTIFELFIALASGFVGAFIVSYPKLGGAMAGVVIAAALVPPLAVTGLAISQSDWQAAGGSFLLYLSNLVAITFASGILFMLARFRGPATDEAKEVRRVNLRWFFILLLIVIIPLYFTTKNTLTQQRQRQIVEKVFSAELGNEVQLAGISTEDRGGVLQINVTVRSERGVSKWDVTKMTEALSRSLKQSVVLKITVIPVVEAGKILPTFNGYDNLMAE